MKVVAFGDWKCHQFSKSDEILYFSYGSCMDFEGFVYSKVDHLFTNVKGRGIAENFQLTFSHVTSDGGKADMTEGRGNVEGKVYVINQKALHYLYLREGAYINVYRPAYIPVIIENVRIPNVLTFLVVNKKPESAPSYEYALEILRGAHGVVSPKYYQQLVKDLALKFKMNVPI